MDAGKSIKIDELLGPARCLVAGGLPQYSGCLRHNIGPWGKQREVARFAEAYVSYCYFDTSLTVAPRGGPR